MNLAAHGGDTFAVEVTNISSHGVWLLTHGKEWFMSYEDFPWFQDQAIKTIFNGKEPSPGHFHWPDLDVDLTEEIIANPARFPHKANLP